MYSWIWRSLPGGTGLKALLSLILVLAVVALLLFVVFPWIEPHLPFNAVTVDG
ncbi:MAG: uncharacterized protein JWP40_3487 [Blastococcus sp.]|jgi:hypothetical protein|nr:uncharacterized protein [Blastococcus sp.]